MKPVRDLWLAHFAAFANCFASRSFLLARRRDNSWLNVATGRGWNHILWLAVSLPNTVNASYKRGKRTKRESEVRTTNSSRSAGIDMCFLQT